MSVNPYESPNSPPAKNTVALTCQRRLDVALITSVFLLVSLAPIAFRSLDAVLLPRFGSSLNFLLFPTIFLCFHLWRPDSKLLWIAASMTALVATTGFYSVCRLGTVETITNPYIHRLPSSYFFSTIPALAASAYLASIAWRLRNHQPHPPKTA